MLPVQRLPQGLFRALGIITGRHGWRAFLSPQVSAVVPLAVPRDVNGEDVSFAFPQDEHTQAGQAYFRGETAGPSIGDSSQVRLHNNVPAAGLPRFVMYVDEVTFENSAAGNVVLSTMATATEGDPATGGGISKDMSRAAIAGTALGWGGTAPVTLGSVNGFRIIHQFDLAASEAFTYRFLPALRIPTGFGLSLRSTPTNTTFRALWQWREVPEVRAP